MHPIRVGPYLLERKLGSGGMGTVYFAHHAETDREAAVKVLSANLAREEGFVARFTREIEAMQQLKNSHIVEFYENGIDEDGTYYYAMEYVEGETLTSLLRRERRLHWQRVIEISLQICAALKTAHNVGIVHRDLKPSNLLIRNDGVVKLADFGVAQLFAANKLTVTGGIIGTAEYMSPEQAQGQRTTKKSDLYSLGAVMYAMLTGRPPFSGKTSLEIIQKHRYARFDKPSLYVPEIPYWLDEIVCQLLEKEPEKRIADALVLSRGLEEVLRKVAMSSDDRTLAMSDLSDRSSPQDGTTQTVTVGADPPAFRDAGPGPGTLMRDLMRAEIERDARESTWSNLLNNTWVLLGLLGLLILGGVFWFREQDLTPEERFERGVALLQQPESSEWQTARDEYFLPLLNEDADRWQADVDPYLQQIELYELRKSLTRPKPIRKSTGPPSEPQRFLQLARHYQEAGDWAEAERLLVSLNVLIASDPEHETVAQLARELLDELRAERAAQIEQNAFLEAALSRAERWQQQGRLEDARALWTSVLDLYGSDPSAVVFAERARSLLKRHSATASPDSAQSGEPAAPAADSASEDAP